MRTRVMQPGRGFVRGLLAKAALAVAAVLATAPARSEAAGPSRLGVETVRAGFANKSKNNLFKVGCWTPVWIQLRGGSERFAEMMEVVVPDDEGTPTTYRQ